MDINIDIGLIIGTALRWLIYTFLIWIMIKIQKLQYSTLGLLVSSGAALLTSFIPVVGLYASYAVLLFCLWRTTRASLAPDVLFTVTVAGALMFCVDLWAISFLMGKIGYEETEMIVEAAELEEELTEPELGGAPTAAFPITPETAPSSEPEVPEPIAEPVLESVPRLREHPLGISACGVAYSTTRPLAMLAAGQQVYTVALGEGFTFVASKSRVQVRCLEINRGSVLVEINGTNQVELLLD